jgi:hypothetical protein
VAQKKKAPPTKKFSSNINGPHKQYKQGGLTKNTKKRQRKITKKKLRAAGLPIPAATKTDPSKFTKLQKKWYDKLAKMGFKDIEWVDHKTGLGQNSDHLRGSMAKGKPWSPSRAQFFRLLQNYLTHYQFKSRRMDAYILARLNEGKTYREIHAGCRQKYKLRKSLYWLYYHIQKLSNDMLAWNKSHANGMLHPDYTKHQLADESMVRGMPVELPNGLRLDPGWWSENFPDFMREDSH